MGRFKSMLYRLMYGRYGTDKLGTCLLITYMILIFVHAILTIFIESVIFDLVTALVSLALAFIIFYRMFSRNIAKRRMENQKFCGFFTLNKNKIRDRKTHIYRKCPQCRSVLRLPRAKGKHFVVCPRCKHRFSVRGR